MASSKRARRRRRLKNRKAMLIALTVRDINLGIQAFRKALVNLSGVLTGVADFMQATLADEKERIARRRAVIETGVLRPSVEKMQAAGVLPPGGPVSIVWDGPPLDVNVYASLGVPAAVFRGESRGPAGG